MGKQFILAAYLKMLVYEYGNLKIHQLLLNKIKTNCFIIQNNNFAVLVDPVDSSELIIDYLTTRKLKLLKMIATHAHFDHILGANGVIKAGLISNLQIHPRDFLELRRVPLYALGVFKRSITLPTVVEYDHNLYHLLNEWRMGLHLAGGHTPGSCFISHLDNLFLITGDLVLNHKLKVGSEGKAEDKNALAHFIDYVEKNYSDSAIIFPGHGDITTVGIERRLNNRWALLKSNLVK